MNEKLEEGNTLSLDFNKLDGITGCVPVVVQDCDTLEVVLLAYTNREAMLQTLAKRRLILWSTSRNELWEKGATSGAKFELESAYVNCEQNSLLYRVRALDKDNPHGICHTRNKEGEFRNCFYRSINLDTYKNGNLPELKNGNP